MNKKLLLTLIPLAVIALIVVARAQSVNTSSPAPAQTSTNSAAQDPAAQFSTLLSNAVLSGRWCLVQNVTGRIKTSHLWALQNQPV